MFKLNTAAQETVLIYFPSAPRGGAAPDGVIRDAANNLYGTSAGGRESNGGNGVLYKLDAAGDYTVLHLFTGGADGAEPQAGLVLDPAGNLYGTTSAHAGEVYKLDATGNFTVLYRFTGGTDGYGPSGVTRDAAGNLYGTAEYGGSAGKGVVFKLDPAHHLTVLHNFTGGSGGATPFGMTLDSAGNFYGTTYEGGQSCSFDSAGCGVVYKLDAGGNYTVLHTFTAPTGISPEIGLAVDPAGNLYGATGYGGSAKHGVIYKLDAAGNYSVLHSFTYTPISGVILDAAGNLYGSASRAAEQVGASYTSWIQPVTIRCFTTSRAGSMGKIQPA